MSGKLIKQRGRLLRVRHVQHMLAAAETVNARDRAAQIESNVQRLAMVRAELFGDAGARIGAHLASHRELATRLFEAGRQLDGALYDQRRVIAQKEALAAAADRDREIAERLKDKARRTAEDEAEARIAALPRGKRMQTRGRSEP